MGGGTGVATHPVAQLTEQVIPTRSAPQHPHRSHPPRARTFHTIYDARGLLIRYNTTFSVANTVDQNIVSRYYNGDGREVKRQKTIFAEDVNMTQPPYGTWTVEQPTYYIRSSVLGGETLTEVDHTGRKVKTNVIAAGAKIATQSQYTWNNADHESVAFHHADASAMSHRSTTGNGSVLWGDGQFDGQAAETDPLGGNMGLETPYVELLPPVEQPDGDWGFTPIDSDAPMIVNGQRVTCTLDGMAIGCAQAQRAMDSGGAIPEALAPWQHLPGFSFTPQGLGIYTYSIPGYAFSTPDGTGDEIVIGSEGEHPDRVGALYFNASWARATGGQKRSDPREDLVAFLEANKNCAGLLTALLLGTGEDALDLAGLSILDTTENPEILDMTREQLGVSGVTTTLRNSRIEGTRAEVVGKNIVIYEEFYTQHSAGVSRGSIMFHELLLHYVLNMTHVNAAATLGITHREPEVPPIPFEFQKWNPNREQNWRDQHRKEWRSVIDLYASDALQKWIDRNCSQ